MSAESIAFAAICPFDLTQIKQIAGTFPSQKATDAPHASKYGRAALVHEDRVNKLRVAALAHCTNAASINATPKRRCLRTKYDIP